MPGKQVGRNPRRGPDFYVGAQPVTLAKGDKVEVKS
jgi:hypothetical protein